MLYSLKAQAQSLFDSRSALKAYRLASYEAYKPYMCSLPYCPLPYQLSESHKETLKAYRAAEAEVAEADAAAVAYDANDVEDADETGMYPEPSFFFKLKNCSLRAVAVKAF